MITRDPFITLAAATGCRKPGAALEEAERAGQADMVRSTELPLDMGQHRPIFEAMGIVFGEPGRDPLFLPATLPAGWKKRATDHAMHNDLLDDKGRKRASIFYKAAFYDRSANMYPCRRYDARANYGDRVWAQAQVLDGDRVVWETERVKITPENEHGVINRQTHEYDVLPIRDALIKKAQAWLDANKPDWRNPLAYW